MTDGRRTTFGAIAAHPLAQLTLVRIREFMREPEAVFWAIFFPILLSAGLGVAFRGGPGEILSVATSSPALAQAMRADAGLDVRETTRESGLEALRSGRAALFAEQAADGGAVYRFDDTNPDGRMARMLADRAVQRAGGRTDPVRASDDFVREPGSRYIDFLVPGLVGLGIMSNAIWGIGFSIVDARRRKLTKRLIATPMSRTYYLLSYLIWRMIVLIAEVGIPVGFGALAFGVPVRGRLIDLALICVLGSLCFSALGLLIASRARTLEGASGLMNLVQVPMWILSGVFFSARRFPDAIQPLIHLLPLTAMIDAMRGHMLQGATLVQLAPELATLAAWLTVCFAVALRLFRWR